MAQAVGKYAAQKFLGSHMKAYRNKQVNDGDDPYFAYITTSSGRKKKVKKQIPAYIPEHDAMILASAKKSAYRLDCCLFNLLGVRFGWEAVIGLVPAAGDAIGVAMAYLVFRKCCEIDGGLPQSVQMHMIINIVLDFIIGLVPILGDLADAAFKCNTKNVRLLEVYLDKKYKPQSSRRDERDLVGVDREQRRRNRASGIYHPQDPPPATVFEDFEDEEGFVGNDGRGYEQGAGGPRAPPPAAQKGGWFSGGRGGVGRPAGQTKASRPPNVGMQETGTVRR